MSIASKTTVGGYDNPSFPEKGQFDVSDNRTAEEFCKALRAQNIDPVFKNWEPVYNRPSEGNCAIDSDKEIE